MARGQRVERDLVADPLHEYGRTQRAARSELLCGSGGCRSSRAVGRPRDDRLTELRCRIHDHQSSGAAGQAATGFGADPVRGETA